MGPSLYKRNKFQIAVDAQSSRSQRISKHGKNVNDIVSSASCATFLFLSYFDITCDLLHTEQMHRNIIDNFKWVKATWVKSGNFRQLWATSGNLTHTHPHRTNKTKQFWQSLRSMIRILSHARSRIQAQQINENHKFLHSQDLQMH